ncbi:NAD-dependent epimerase/dehydratase family protein [Hymenobacter humi]|uniref:NAD-dependent epimerase/dehydratase family protein n=1 Tax=Hymenobacter humi TaxID=1411620 RepID=A0ABW2UBU8_9BACT
MCEHEAQQVFGARTLIIRPGLLVGPLDPTDRFTYWVSRVARGGEVLAPGSPNRFVQFMDARDLAQWIVELIEHNAAGVFNAACPPFSLTFAQLLAAIKAVTQSDASFTWADDAFLQQQRVKEWSEMPLYLAQSSQETRGFMAANIDKALAANLTFRPLADTIRDTLEWRATQPSPLQAGIDDAREKELLDTWHHTSQGVIVTSAADAR